MYKILQKYKVRYDYVHFILNSISFRFVLKKQLKLWLNVPKIATAPLSKHVETKDVLILAA